MSRCDQNRMSLVTFFHSKFCIKTRRAFAAAKPPDPPRHLSKKMKQFWTGVFELKNLQPYEALILEKACEAHDRAEQARHILKREGLTYEDRFKMPRSPPEVAIERDSKALFAKLLKQIQLWNEYWGAAE
jgi:phage terminase small subunit